MNSKAGCTTGILHPDWVTYRRGFKIPGVGSAVYRLNAMATVYSVSDDELLQALGGRR